MWSNNDLMDSNYKPSKDHPFILYMNEKKTEFLKTHKEHYNTVHVTNWAEDYVRKLEVENARYREALELIATAQEQWSLEATLRSFVFELQKRTEIAQRALKGGE